MTTTSTATPSPRWAHWPTSSRPAWVDPKRRRLLPARRQRRAAALPVPCAGWRSARQGALFAPVRRGNEQIAPHGGADLPCTCCSRACRASDRPARLWGLIGRLRRRIMDRLAGRRAPGTGRARPARPRRSAALALGPTCRLPAHRGGLGPAGEPLVLAADDKRQAGLAAVPAPQACRRDGRRCQQGADGAAEGRADCRQAGGGRRLSAGRLAGLGPRSGPAGTRRACRAHRMAGAQQP
mmetsp:Transcript_4855/g.17302  ORF Transcript_4855/g.17302 Transcript_4855/m.17302 type:complete len:239 (+) Transcript_4855:1516-2232(+)